MSARHAISRAASRASRSRSTRCAPTRCAPRSRFSASRSACSSSSPWRPPSTASTRASRKDIESAGATTFYVQRWPVGIQHLRRHRRDVPLAAQPAASSRRGRHARPAALGRRRHRRDRFHGDRSSTRTGRCRRRRFRATRPGWTNDTAATSIRAARSRPRRTRAARTSCMHQRQDGQAPLSRRAIRSGGSITIDNSPYEVIGSTTTTRASSPAASAPLGIMPIQTLLRHFTVARATCRLHGQAARGRRPRQAIDDVIARLRGASRAPAAHGQQLLHPDAGPAVRGVQPDLRRVLPRDAGARRRSASSSAASASSRS